MLFALTLAIIIVWFNLEFGKVSFVTVLLTTIFSQWVTVFGRNLWWVMWAFYLPFDAIIPNPHKILDKIAKPTPSLFLGNANFLSETKLIKKATVIQNSLFSVLFSTHDIVELLKN